MTQGDQDDGEDGDGGVYGDFNGERVHFLEIEVGDGIIGVPVGPGPKVEMEQDAGPDLVVDTLLIRDVVWDSGVSETVALVLGELMADEALGLAAIAAGRMARVSKTTEGFRMALWRWKATT